MPTVRPLAWIGLALIMAGCGDSTGSFDPAATYTPATLAQELIFRYKTLDPGKRDVRKPVPPRKADAAVRKEAKAATKDAPAATLDDLIREVTTKAESIPGLAAAEALRRVADEVDRDPSIDAPGRKTIVDRLRGGGE